LEHVVRGAKKDQKKRERVPPYIATTNQDLREGRGARHKNREQTVGVWKKEQKNQRELEGGQKTNLEGRERSKTPQRERKIPRQRGGVNKKAKGDYVIRLRG